MDGVYGFLKLILPPAEYKAQDGTSYPSADAAALHDALPQLCSPDMVAAALTEFNLTYRELARLVGCSEQWLRLIVRCKKPLSERLAFRLWPALVRLDTERKSYSTPQVLLRIERDCLIATERMTSGMPADCATAPSAGRTDEP